MIPAYPLAWPDGWPRTPSYQRKRDTFGTQETKSNSAGGSWRAKKAISIADAMRRVREELGRLGVSADDLVVSTNLRLNMAGLPRGDQGAPSDPGVAVYWQAKGKPQRVMAIDAYERVAGNLAAIAATLEAMRAIDRHGGAQILDRAFTGFTALPAPKRWPEILGVSPAATAAEIERAFKAKARQAHPDAGGSTARMAELNAARDQALRERSA
jgi:hypothetical protein